MSGFVGSVTKGTISWVWNQPSDLHYSHTEIRSADADWGSTSAQPLFRGAATGWQEVVTASGARMRYARHLSLSGVPSAASANASATVLAAELFVDDAALATAQTKNRIFLATSAPTAEAAGDLWIDSDNGNRIYRASAAGAGSWVALPYDTEAVDADAITEVVLVEDAGPVDTYGATSGSPVTVISVSAGPYGVDSEILLTVGATVDWNFDPDYVGPPSPNAPHLFEIGNATDGWQSYKFGYLYSDDSISLFAARKFTLPASTTRTYTLRATLSTAAVTGSPDTGDGNTDWTNISATAVALKR